MTGLARHGLPIRVVRTAIELAVLGLGLALGGPVGLGTVLFALAIGPLVQLALRRLRPTRPDQRPYPCRRPHSRPHRPDPRPAPHLLPGRARVTAEAAPATGVTPGKLGCYRCRHRLASVIVSQRRSSYSSLRRVGTYARPYRAGFLAMTGAALASELAPRPSR